MWREGGREGGRADTVNHHDRDSDGLGIFQGQIGIAALRHLSRELGCDTSDGDDDEDGDSGDSVRSPLRPSLAIVRPVTRERAD